MRQGPGRARRRELLRLVEEELPIAEFDKSRLGPQGSVVTEDYDGFHPATPCTTA